MAKSVSSHPHVIASGGQRLKGIAFATGVQLSVSALALIFAEKAFPGKVEELCDWISKHVILPHMDKLDPIGCKVFGGEPCVTEEARKERAHQWASMITRIGILELPGEAASFLMQWLLGHKGEDASRGFWTTLAARFSTNTIELGAAYTLNRAAPGISKTAQAPIRGFLADHVFKLPEQATQQQIHSREKLLDDISNVLSLGAVFSLSGIPVNYAIEGRAEHAIDVLAQRLGAKSAAHTI